MFQRSGFYFKGSSKGSFHVRLAGLLKGSEMGFIRAFRDLIRLLYSRSQKVGTSISLNPWSNFLGFTVGLV